MQNKKIIISPSLICADLCNLEQDVKQFESLGVQSLHIDLIDGHFSPSLPLGLATVEQLRKKSNLDFDVHIMATDNEFFIHELLKIGVQSITFHYETTRHADRLLQRIGAAGVKAGIALTPATPPEVLRYVAERCDLVLLMLISPGYAGHAGETMVPYALKKIKDCKTYLDAQNTPRPIAVDGRVALTTIPSLVAAGAEILIAGSTSFFCNDHSKAENLSIMKEKIAMGLKGEIQS